MTKPKIEKSDEEWRKVLGDRYHIIREKGTERAFTGEYYDHHDDGTYLCAACGERLFSSETKYESGSGWPSFFQPMSQESIEEHSDVSHGMRRVEITCARCGAHLGHVFDDGPRPTGLRYCVNSASLKFEKKT